MLLLFLQLLLLLLMVLFLLVVVLAVLLLLLLMLLLVLLMPLVLLWVLLDLQRSHGVVPACVFRRRRGPVSCEAARNGCHDGESPGP